MKLDMEIEILSPHSSANVAAPFLIDKKGEAYLQTLEQRIQELRQLCQDIDPYSPLSDEEEKLLAKHHIYSCFDPFVLTNKLILALEDALEEWHRLTNTPLD